MLVVVVVVVVVVLLLLLLLLMLLLLLLSAAVRHRVPDFKICSVFHCIWFQCFRSLMFKRDFFNKPLGSTVAFWASIFSPTIQNIHPRCYRHARSQGVSPPRRSPPCIPYFIFCHMLYTRQHAILEAGLRDVPFLLYVVLVGVICMSYVVTVYECTTNCEYCQFMGQYRISHITCVQPPCPYQ